MNEENKILLKMFWPYLMLFAVFCFLAGYIIGANKTQDTSEVLFAVAMACAYGLFPFVLLLLTVTGRSSSRLTRALGALKWFALAAAAVQITRLFYLWHAAGSLWYSNLIYWGSIIALPTAAFLAVCRRERRGEESPTRSISGEPRVDLPAHEGSDTEKKTAAAVVG